MSKQMLLSMIFVGISNEASTSVQRPISSKTQATRLRAVRGKAQV
jgi:hypothetical protein